MIELREYLEFLVGELFEVFAVLHLLDGHNLVGESVPSLVHVTEVAAPGLY